MKTNFVLWNVREKQIIGLRKFEIELNNDKNILFQV